MFFSACMTPMASGVAFTLTIWTMVTDGAHAQRGMVVAMKAPSKMISAYTSAGIAIEYIEPEIVKHADEPLKNSKGRRVVVRDI